MTEANLVRVLQSQTRLNVSLLRYDTIAQGAEQVQARIAELRAQGVGMAIADALSDSDLYTLGSVCADLPLLTGGSGLALGLPENFRRVAKLRDLDASKLPVVSGGEVVLAGSASIATNGQVAAWLEAVRPDLRIDPLALAAREPVVAQAFHPFWQPAHAPGVDDCRLHGRVAYSARCWWIPESVPWSPTCCAPGR